MSVEFGLAYFFAAFFFVVFLAAFFAAFFFVAISAHLLPCGRPRTTFVR